MRADRSLALLGALLLTAGTVTAQAPPPTLADDAQELVQAALPAPADPLAALATVARGASAAGAHVGDALGAAGAARAVAAAAAATLAFLADAAGSALALLLAGGAALADAPPAAQAAAAGSAATAAAGATAWKTGLLRRLRALPLLAGPLYARIRKERLLEHGVRAALYEAVRTRPGTHASELARGMDVSWGTLLHHLDKLEAAALVTSTHAGGRKCYFLPGATATEDRPILTALQGRTARRLTEYFQAHPGAAQSDAARELGLSPAIVSWHLQRLAAAGVVERARSGRANTVTVGPRAAALLAGA